MSLQTPSDNNQYRNEDNRPDVSVVITVYNEEENIKELIDQLRAALNGVLSYEVIFVNDGSTDKTADEVKAHADQYIFLLTLMKNSGQTTAMKAGIDQARGKFVVTMDGDLQNDPSDIPELYNKINETGKDMITGYRKNRQDGMFLRKIPSKIANALIRKMTGVYVSDYGCSLKIYRSDLAKNLNLYGELHRFIPVLAHLEGGTISEIPVKHHPRIHGTSKYGLGRTFRVVADLMLMVFLKKYTQKPIHLFGILGFLAFAGGVGINIYLLIEKMLGQDIWGRPLLILGVVMLLSGIQFITFGLLSEILTRIYFESQSKKTYRLREVYHGD